MTTEDANDLLHVKYFWEERGDPTRFTGWGRVTAKFPELKQTWEAYQTAGKIFGYVVNGLKEEAERVAE